MLPRLNRLELREQDQRGNQDLRRQSINETKDGHAYKIIQVPHFNLSKQWIYLSAALCSYINHILACHSKPFFQRVRPEVPEPRFTASRPEARDPRSEMLDPRSEIRGPRSQVRYPQPEVRDEVRDQRSEVRDPRSETRGLRRGPRPEIRGPRFEVRGSRCEVRGPRLEVRDPRSEVRGPRPEVRDPRSEVGTSWRQQPSLSSRSEVRNRDPRSEVRGPRSEVATRRQHPLSSSISYICVYISTKLTKLSGNHPRNVEKSRDPCPGSPFSAPASFLAL